MSMRIAFLAAAAFSLMAVAPGHAAEGPHRIGGGANYWIALDDLDSDVDDDGFSYVVSYQYRPGLVGLGIDAELLPDRFGDDAYAGQAYLILGQGLYAAAGVGVNYMDSEFADDPFFTFRAGLEFPVLPNLYLDLHAHYRFEDEQDLKDEDTKIDTDTVFLGAAVRMGF